MTFEEILVKLNDVEVSAAIAIAIGGVIEFLLGMIKTTRPARLAYLIANAFIKWGKFLDSVLPQRVKDASDSNESSKAS